ncbi:MAG TPA: beta-ketoacyl synthase N-terminal-like domain-containing protein, partial [Euzebya sp.]|nr:beta-ketoacyl synthase N-terminal-like domain-containing protein [Euzebya sp.]
GVILGTGVGPMESMEEFANPLFDEGPAAANPAVFPNTVYNAAAGQVAIKLGLIGPTSTVTAGHAAGLHALQYAAELARADHADVMVALAADALTDTVAAAYRQIVGDAFALAESAVAIVCERASHAEARGARIYGQILGTGIASDGLGAMRWSADGEGMERAVRAALADAEVDAHDLAAVYTSAAGLERADSAEAAALDRVLGDTVLQVAPKKTLGEPMGVGGALCSALALLSYDRGGDTAGGPVLMTSSSLGGTHFVVVLGP